jgi:hypothetical protein
VYRDLKTAGAVPPAAFRRCDHPFVRSLVPAIFAHISRSGGDHGGAEPRVVPEPWHQHTDTLEFLPKHAWSLTDNSFRGTHELAGLRVVLMMLSNWDAKDLRSGEDSSNTAVFRGPDGQMLGLSRCYISVAARAAAPHDALTYLRPNRGVIPSPAIPLAVAELDRPGRAGGSGDQFVFFEAKDHFGALSAASRRSSLAFRLQQETRVHTFHRVETQSRRLPVAVAIICRQAYTIRTCEGCAPSLRAIPVGRTIEHQLRLHHASTPPDRRNFRTILRLCQSKSTEPAAVPMLTSFPAAATGAEICRSAI